MHHRGARGVRAHLDRGTIVYAGVDYAEILASAQKEADVIVWDGGNNDFSFYKPDLQIVVADPHRPGHERTYHPGETNLRLAHVVVINKEDDRRPGEHRAVLAIGSMNPTAVIIDAASPFTLDKRTVLGGRAARHRGRAHAHPRRDALRRRRDRGEAPRRTARSSTRGRGWSARSSTRSASIRRSGRCSRRWGIPRNRFATWSGRSTRRSATSWSSRRRST